MVGFSSGDLLFDSNELFSSTGWKGNLDGNDYHALEMFCHA